MKKNIFIYFLLLIILVNNKVNASGVIAGATFPQQIVQQITDVVNLSSNVSGDVMQGISTMKETVGNPIASMLIDAAQKEVTKNILNWANGGFNGAPVLISNPESFIKNAGLSSIKASLNRIPTNSVLGDSIFSSIVNNNKDVGLASQLTSLSKSPTASVFKKSNCDDPNTLLKIATNEVNAIGGTQDDITTKYKEYYNAICVGNPDTDPVVARRLDTIAANNPSLGSWDLWLTSTSDTEQQRVRQANMLVAADAAKKAELAKQELSGIGAVSQKECIERSIPGDDTSACKTWNTLTSGQSVQAAITDAASAPLKRLSGLTGADGLTSVLSSFIVGAMTSALNTSRSSGATSNSATTVSSARPAQENLSASEQQTITRPIYKQFKYQLSIWLELEDTDNAFLEKIAGYESYIREGKSCYDNAVANYSSLANNNQVIVAYAFYKNRQDKVDNLKSSISEELPKITAGKAYLLQASTTLPKLTSSSDIQNLYNDYTTTIDMEGYPTNVDMGKRKGEFTQSNQDINDDTSTISGHIGPMIQKNQECYALISAQQEW